MPATAERIIELRNEYGLTEKQARFVEATLEAPESSQTARALEAGYTYHGRTTRGGAHLKGPKMIEAVKAEIKKRGNVKLELEKLNANPKEYLKERFIENSADENITSVQHASLEAIAKLEGLYTAKVELDVGQKTRELMAGQLLGGVLDEAVGQIESGN